MDAVEILKGSSQVKYGPQATGGVINFVSTPIPAEAAGYAKLAFGSDNTWLGHFHFGDTVRTGNGGFGWLLELFGQTSDGFREIGKSPGFRNPGTTGFGVLEPMIKLSWEPSGGPPQRFEFKAGYTSFDADETYLGLSEKDARENPQRRYAATRFDNIETGQFRTYLKHRIEANDHVTVNSSVYYNKFERDWFKLDSVNRANGGRAGLSQALMNPADLAILRGRSRLHRCRVDFLQCQGGQPRTLHPGVGAQRRHRSGARKMGGEFRHDLCFRRLRLRRQCRSAIQ